MVNVESKRKIKRFLIKANLPTCLLLFFIGIGFIFIFPNTFYNKRTYISENALLPGQASTEYATSENSAAEVYREQLKGIQGKTAEIRADFIKSEFENICLVSTIQSFVDPTDGHVGVNTFAIHRAPRGDGKEALVLSAPWVSRTGDRKQGSEVKARLTILDNTNGIAMLLSLVRFFTRNNYWSKDLIFLVTDKGMAGTQAWLSAYHGVDDQEIKGSLSSVQMPRSGAIQAALNLDFPGEHNYGSLGIFFEGVNGQLPNLDLINTFTLISHRYMQLSVLLHDSVPAILRGGAWESYFGSLWPILRTMMYQATCHPSSEAGLYLRYKIDAITLHGVNDAENLGLLLGVYSIGFHSIGTVVESIFRSLNNLLEHFHQSFFFYILPAVDRYVSIADYMPPVILFTCSAVFQYALILYHIDPSIPDEPTDSTSKLPATYFTKPRPIGFSFAVLIGSHLTGAMIFYLLQPHVGLWMEAYVDPTTILSVQYGGAICLSIFTLFAYTRWCTSRPVSASKARILKSLLLAQEGLVISTVSLLNLGLGIATAIATVLPYSLIQANGPTSWRLRSLQLQMVLAVSPPGIIALVSLVLNIPHIDILRFVLNDYQVVHSWLLPFICLVYWPMNLTAQVLVMSQ